MALRKGGVIKSQKTNQRDGQPEAVQSPESSFTHAEECRRLIRHHVQRAKQLERDFLLRRCKQDQSTPKPLEALQR